MTKFGKIRLGFAILVGSYVIFKKLSDDAIEIEEQRRKIEELIRIQRKRFDKDVMNFWRMEDIKRILHDNNVIEYLGGLGDLSYSDLMKLKNFAECDLRTEWDCGE